MVSARTTLAVILALGAAAAQAQAVKVVGIGTSSCRRFQEDIIQRPVIERDYFAWAQGFMSGALVRAPQGVDEELDLNPPDFPLRTQADFLRAFCLSHPDQDYLDAARALYRRMRKPGT